MNYYIKKDLKEIVRAKKCSSAFFAMREGATVPAIKKEGYMVEHASTTTSGLVTREFMSVFEFESNYNPTDIATLDVTAIGTMITSFAAADITRPTVVSTSPANNANTVGSEATIKVTFSEAIVGISGKKAVLYKKTGETWTKIEDAVSMSIGGSGDKDLIIGHNVFDNDITVKVVIPADTVKDASANGNKYNTAYSFEFTVLPELALTSIPLIGAENVAVDANIVVTSTNALSEDDCIFTLRKLSDASVVATTVTYDATKKIVTINPDANLAAATEYGLTYNVEDIGAQAPGSSSTITFTTAA